MATKAEPGFTADASSKEPVSSAGDVRGSGSVPGLGRSPGGGDGHPLSTPAWRTPWTEETGRATVHEWQRVGPN